ncbi:MAG: HEPN domain-containing protein [Perlabentimonas sp.]
MTEYKKEDYIRYRIERAKETLDEVKVHIENKFWNTAINRLYYACFYAAGALLMKHNIEVSSHAGVRQKFGQHFVKTEKFNRELAKHYTELFEKRHKGDYNDFYDYDEETVLRLYPISREFISQINKLIND